MNIKIKIDRAAVKSKLTVRAADALNLMSEQLLKDCNYYAPQDQGTLINSGIIHSETEGAAIVLRWETPYARRMYFGISKTGKPLNYSKQPNPNACKMWAHKAQSVKGEQWRRQLETLIGGK